MSKKYRVSYQIGACVDIFVDANDYDEAVEKSIDVVNSRFEKEGAKYSVWFDGELMEDWTPGDIDDICSVYEAEKGIVCE